MLQNALGPAEALECSTFQKCVPRRSACTVPHGFGEVRTLDFRRPLPVGINIALGVRGSRRVHNKGRSCPMQNGLFRESNPGLRRTRTANMWLTAASGPSSDVSHFACSRMLHIPEMCSAPVGLHRPAWVWRGSNSGLQETTHSGNQHCSRALFSGRSPKGRGFESPSCQL